MDKRTKQLAHEAIRANVDDTTAVRIIEWVLWREPKGLGLIDPSNECLAKKFGWKKSTVKVAISKAKKSGFITTTGTKKNRTFEINMQFLKSKMAEISSMQELRARKKLLNLNEIRQLVKELENNSSAILDTHTDWRWQWPKKLV